MFSGPIGILHFVVSLVALLSGTVVLAGTKGDATHRRVGYVYTAAMVVVLVTSFTIYRLHGTFGILHWFAVISSLTLLAGIIPMLLRRPTNYLALHFSFMYWSVIGLYCAFCAEILTRLPYILDLDRKTITLFYTLVGVATGLVGGIGSVYFRKYKDRWNSLVQQFGDPSKSTEE